MGKKKRCLYYIKYPLINIIKCLIFLIWHILEARAESKKIFCSFFGVNENKKSCFWNLLTFTKSWWNYRFSYTASSGCCEMDLQFNLQRFILRAWKRRPSRQTLVLRQFHTIWSQSTIRSCTHWEWLVFTIKLPKDTECLHFTTYLFRKNM